MQRREFLHGMIGAGLTAATCGSSSVAEWITANESVLEGLRVGLELYSLRKELDRNVAAALGLARQMGFEEVEVAMLHGLRAGEFASALKAAGMKATSMAASYEDLQTKLELVKERADAFSAKWVVLAWIPHSGEFTVEIAKRVAAELSVWGKSLAKSGMRLAYHPHGYEFRPEAGGSAFDVMLQETDLETVFFEVDTFWVEVAGQNCARLIGRLGKRVRMLHLKDLRKGVKTGAFTGAAADEDSVALGDGMIDWRATLAAARKAGVEKYFIEDESPAVEEQVPKSLEFLAKM